MDYATLAKQFWDNGYLAVENFFEKDLMDRLDRLIVNRFGDNPEYFHNEEFLTKSKVDVSPWFPHEDNVPDFKEVDENSNLTQLTDAILGNDWESGYCMAMFSKKGSNGQSWHQDCPPEEKTKFNLNRLVYSSDVTSENGGLTVLVPGSHRKGLLPLGDPNEDMEGQIKLEIKKGTLILLHGFTWHRVLSVKANCRVSTNYRAMPKGTPTDITDVCVYRNMRYRFSTNEIVEERRAA